MSKNQPQRRFGNAHLVALLLATLGLVCLITHRRASALERRHQTASRRVAQMLVDAEKVSRLQSAPRLAVDRRRPDDELIAQIQNALDDARISADRWLSTEPSAAMRVRGTAYQEVTTRLSLHAISLRQLANFVFALASDDASLRVAGLRLRQSRVRAADAWDADLAVTYYLYSPTSADGPPPHALPSDG